MESICINKDPIDQYIEIYEILDNITKNPKIGTVIRNFDTPEYGEDDGRDTILNYIRENVMYTNKETEFRSIIKSIKDVYKIVPFAIKNTLQFPRCGVCYMTIQKDNVWINCSSILNLDIKMIQNQCNTLLYENSSYTEILYPNFKVEKMYGTVKNIPWYKENEDIVDMTEIICDQFNVNIELVPQKLCIFGPGEYTKFFIDNPIEAIGTVILFFPSQYVGEGLVIKNADKSINFQPNCQHLNWVAFHKDCDYEIKPIMNGHCVMMIFSIMPCLKFVNYFQDEMEIESLEISEPSEFIKNRNIMKLHQILIPNHLLEFGVVLTHQYKHCELTPDILKGADKDLFNVLNSIYKVTLLHVIEKYHSITFIDRMDFNDEYTDDIYIFTKQDLNYLLQLNDTKPIYPFSNIPFIVIKRGRCLRSEIQGNSYPGMTGEYNKRDLLYLSAAIIVQPKI